ncbi:uncharacterized protein BJ212DRAFT_1328035 [Suillus subaureus]|uniref:DUF6534 domain-containing protein n=1 Tax=Suillus subaureus TaxID=48587 RepID=A0A9P7JGU3_9AGAM|nr:uncharacterized protein BJ212DRAFT_1328035 [Suillus subaureus]KAG1822475.1 hypothetical protein BJ212DRAFT_1328035 [Suillus subaureus]
MMNSPSLTEVENLVVIYLGFAFATFLYGLTFFQTYIYFSRYSNDHTWTKVLVGALFVLDTASAGLVSDLVYDYLITMFEVRMEVIYATPAFCIQYLLSVIITLIAQLFFARRLYTVCCGPTRITSRSVSVVVLFCAFIAFVFGLISVGQFFQQRQLSAFALPPMAIVAGISQGFATIANIIIFIAMYWSLRPARYPDIPLPKGAFDNLSMLFAGRGLALIVIQMAYFGTFVASPGKPYWVAVQMVTPKVYANTVLGLLNAREVKRGVGLNEEETLSDRHDSRDDGLPSALQFRSTKATQQSLSFSQEAENSRSSEIEAISKSFSDDQNLESIRSRCSDQLAYDKASLS